ncbi:MAG: hypothetical protein ACRELC_03890 [Gemmatimonadota bacterium]
MRRARVPARWLATASAALLGALATAGPVVGACPGCIEGSSKAVASGFAWSIAFMMAVPYALLGAIGGGLYLAYRRAARREVEAFLEEERGPRIEGRVRSGGPDAS